MYISSLIKKTDSYIHKIPCAPPPFFFLVFIDIDHSIIVLLWYKNLCKFLTFQKCREKYRYPYTETTSQNIYKNSMWRTEDQSLYISKSFHCTQLLGTSWPHFFFSKIFYSIFGYFTTFISLETWHFNLNVLYKDIILFSMWCLYTSIFLMVFLNYISWWWSWLRLKHVVRSGDKP